MADEPVRILEIEEDKLTAEQKKVFDALVAGRGRLLTPYKIWIHSPELAAALETIGTFLNKKSSLTVREVELTIVIIATHWQGDYVQAAHVKLCLELGYPQAAMDAIKAGRTPDLPDTREKAVYDLCQIAMAPGGGSDEVYERAEKLLGREGLAEVLALLGYYSSVAMAMKLHRVPVPATIAT
jgi:4-carboxymuconolactone decarboxylase